MKQQTLFDFKKTTDELIQTATFQGADIDQEILGVCYAM